MNKIIDKLKRNIIQVRLLIIRNGWKKAKLLKKNNVFYNIGEDCYYHPNILPAEPFLVCLHNNVVISAGVRIITHSAVHNVFNNEDKTNLYRCKFGKVEIEDNVYIGANVIINYGVTIGKNSIIAAGAVVTKDVEPGSVMAGVPATRIGSYFKVKEKNYNYSKEYSENVGRTVKEMNEINPIKFNIKKGQK